jgi:hypothetical protein
MRIMASRFYPGECRDLYSNATTNSTAAAPQRSGARTVRGLMALPQAVFRTFLAQTERGGRRSRKMQSDDEYSVRQPGDLAVYTRPMALRPGLTTGLPLSGNSA